MKVLHYKNNNVESEIIGRITFNKSLFAHRNECIFILRKSESLPVFSNLYRGILTEENLSISVKGSGVIEDSSEYHEGDIVLLTPDGKATFLYENGIDSNVLFITGKCNQRCLTCPQPPVNEEPDLTNVCKEIIKLAKNPTYFGISGGEPTVKKEKMIEVLRLLKKKHRNTAVTILSNAVRFSDTEFCEKLAAIDFNELQLDVPIFSDIPSIHNELVGAKNFYRTINGLYNLAEHKIKVGIRIVVNKLNYARLPQISEYIFRNFTFVSQLAFMQMENKGLAFENLDKLWIDPSECTASLSKAVRMLEERQIPAFIYNWQLCLLPSDLRPLATDSISPWKKVFCKECDPCLRKNDCPGFFASNINMHSSHITPFGMYNKDTEISFQSI